jgi:small nuclear ribonucleoprotein G
MASKQGYGPDLRKFLNKRLDIKLNGSRAVTGVMTGYDQFMNVVLENTIEHVSATVKREIGTVFIRGNSIVMWECLDKITST